MNISTFRNHDLSFNLEDSSKSICDSSVLDNHCLY